MRMLARVKMVQTEAGDAVLLCTSRASPILRALPERQAADRCRRTWMCMSPSVRGCMGCVRMGEACCRACYGLMKSAERLKWVGGGGGRGVSWVWSRVMLYPPLMLQQTQCSEAVAMQMIVLAIFAKLGETCVCVCTRPIQVPQTCQANEGTNAEECRQPTLQQAGCLHSLVHAQESCP